MSKTKYGKICAFQLQMNLDYLKTFIQTCIAPDQAAAEYCICNSTGVTNSLFFFLFYRARPLRILRVVVFESRRRAELRPARHFHRGVIERRGGGDWVRTRSGDRVRRLPWHLHHLARTGPHGPTVKVFVLLGQCEDWRSMQETNA